MSNVDRVRLSELLQDRSEELFVAMDNAPSKLVLAGRARAVQAAIHSTGWRHRGAACLRAGLAHALFEDAAIVLRGYYNQFAAPAPEFPCTRV